MKQFVMTIILLSILGCIPESEKESDDSIASQVRGLWKSSCINIESSKYVKYAIDVDEDLTTYTEYYNDDTCTEINSQTDARIYEYTLGDSTLSEGGLEAVDIDMTLQNVEDVDLDKFASTTILGIYRIDDDILYMGINTRVSTRTLSLNFDISYTKEN